jgi:hypothetical protein
MGVPADFRDGEKAGEKKPDLRWPSAWNIVYQHEHQ